LFDRLAAKWVVTDPDSGINRTHVAKIEAERYNFTIATLYMLAGALGKDIEFGGCQPVKRNSFG